MFQIEFIKLAQVTQLRHAGVCTNYLDISRNYVSRSGIRIFNDRRYLRV